MHMANWSPAQPSKKSSVRLYSSPSEALSGPVSVGRRYRGALINTSLLAVRRPAARTDQEEMSRKSADGRKGPISYRIRPLFVTRWDRVI